MAQNCSHIFLQKKNKTLEILVHLRSKFKDQDPDKWDTRFGGHLNSGKSIEETLIKEIKEETGLQINFSNLLKGVTVKYNGGKNKEFFSIYYYNFLGNKEELSFDDGEVQEVKWMSEVEIIQSMDKNPEKWAAKKYGFIEVMQYLKEKL